MPGKLYLLISFGFFLITGCIKEDPGKSVGDDEALISLFINPLASTINQDAVLWEDRVEELRMLVFDTANGQVVFNQKLYFPNGFTNRSRAVVLPVGTYDFYFVANETVYSGAFVSALIGIQNISEFQSDTRFTTLGYNPDFMPDETSSTGRFVMSAVYTNISIVSGGTETNPLLLPLPTGKVELIRSLAKVEVIFRKKVSGGDVPENTISFVLLENVASYLSVPPYDNYYNGPTLSTPLASLTGLDYTRDSIGSVVFYIPEMLLAPEAGNNTVLEINNNAYPIQNDENKAGLTQQRRIVPSLSDSSVIRNYHYQVNVYIDSEGGLQIRTYVQPWQQEEYNYLFQGELQITIPPVIPTDSSIIIDTECGKVEILSHNEFLQHGLQGAYNDTVNYYDPVLQGPTIYKGNPPYYCEKKYGPGWRLINSCELLSFLGVLDVAYKVWLSNTWLAAANPVPYYPIQFRQTAQSFLEVLSGEDLSGSVFYPENNFADEIVDVKLGIVDDYFTPGDIRLKEEDFPGGWPFSSPPGTDLEWFYNQVSIQVKAFWYDSGYISPANRENWDEILYNEFERYDFSSTVSRCVRSVE